MSQKKKISLFSIAKYTNKELLLEGLLQSKGIYQLRILERYKYKQRSLKIKVIVSKIVYAIIFGILPIMILIPYFLIIEDLMESSASTESIIFIGGFFFTLYFAMQFFNFFLMGLLESGMIMSGIMFRWFETLPISRDKLRKLAYLTLLRSFDIPIIVIIIGFPITILIGTQNVIFFFVALGISILNIIFTFNILILLGERLNRVLDFNEISSKRSFAIRLVNLISHIIVILSSVYAIQWAINSIDVIFRSIIEFENSTIINIILSSIPYPFNLGYLISFIIAFKQVSIGFWISIFIGLGLFVILTWWLHLKASKTLERITFAKYHNLKRDVSSKKIKEKKTEISIKTRSPLKAYLHKDLTVASHDLNTFLSMLMPIILSSILTFSFSIGNIGVPFFLERDLFFNWIGILVFSPFISGMLVYGILNIEISGESVLASLPINPRDQAKGKLILLMILQTIAVFSPLLIYITSEKFIFLLLTVITSLPIAWIFLVLTFELRIHFFSKFKNHYVIEEINPENRLFKWTLIISIQYILSFWIISLLFTFYIHQDFESFIIFFFSVSLIGSLSVIFIFDKMFPHIPDFKTFPIIKPKYLKEVKPTTFSKNRWLSIVLLMVLFFASNLLSNYLLSPLLLTSQSFSPFGNYRSVPISILLYIILYNFSQIILLIILIPKVIGVPYGRQPLKQYLESIKAKWVIYILKYFIWGSCVVFFILLSFLLLDFINLGVYFIPASFSYEIFGVILSSSALLWQEVFFRGIILTILLNKRSNKKAIFLDACLFGIFSTITYLPVFFVFFGPFGSIFMPSLLIIFILSFIEGLLLAYLSIKKNNIFPGILTLITLNLIGISIFPPVQLFFLS